MTDESSPSYEEETKPADAEEELGLIQSSLECVKAMLEVGLAVARLLRM